MSKQFSITVTNSDKESKPYLIASKGGKVVDEDLLKIRDMWLENKADDRIIALGWLAEKFNSKRVAVANLLMLYATYPMADEEGVEKTKFSYPDGCWYERYNLSDTNYIWIEHETYPTYFGKDYRYRYTFKFMLGGELILDTMHDYSRYAAAQNMPHIDFAYWLTCKLVDEHRIPRVVWLNGTVDYPENYLPNQTVI